MAERQARQIAQEEAQKTKKTKNTDKEITNLLGFKKRQAYAQNKNKYGKIQKRAIRALFYKIKKERYYERI